MPVEDRREQERIREWLRFCAWFTSHHRQLLNGISLSVTQSCSYMKMVGQFSMTLGLIFQYDPQYDPGFLASMTPGNPLIQV